MDTKKKRRRTITRCVVCHKEVPEVALKNDDPYCSATCCREAYGTQLAPTQGPGRVSSYAPRQR